MARPHKLTDQLQDRIANSLRAGIPVRWACEAAGISTTIYYAWKAQGEEWLDVATSKVPQGQRRYVQFSDTMRQARAEGLALPAGQLYKLITSDTVDRAVQLRGLIFFLTHADREHWHPVQHADGVGAEDVEVVLSWD